MYLATSETKARAKTHPSSSFRRQKFPGLMKRELSLRCARKAWSTGKGKKGKILALPPSSPSLSLFSINLFAFLVLPDSDQWSARGPPRVFFARTGPLLTGRLGIIRAFLVYRFLPIWVPAWPPDRENNSRRGYECQIKVIGGKASSVIVSYESNFSSFFFF